VKGLNCSPVGGGPAPAEGEYERIFEKRGIMMEKFVKVGGVVKIVYQTCYPLEILTVRPSS
jgi:hypothetical protein